MHRAREADRARPGFEAAVKIVEVEIRQMRIDEVTAARRALAEMEESANP